VDGEVESVASLRRDDLIAFHASRYGPQGSGWVVAGDVEPGEMADLLEARLGAAPRRAEAPEVPRIEAPPRLTGPRVLLVDRPGAPQAVIRVGHAGVPFAHPDHDALTLWNHILGGQFTSRLNARLREEKGYTYGIRSHFDFRRGAGPFWIGASLESGRLAEALEDLRHEVAALLADRPPTPAELDDARRALIEGQARHFENPGALVSRFTGTFLHALPLDHHRRLAERLGALGADAVIDAARRHVHPEALAVVVVADADAVRPRLESLGWGPVDTVTSRPSARLG
jgi:predicted Zn-dependent peptidase